MSLRRGVVLVLFLIGLAVTMSIIGLVGLALLIDRGPTVARNSTVVLRVGGALEETPAADVFAQALTGSPPTVRGIVETIRKAKADPRVTGILLVPTGFTTYWGKVQEIRDAVIDFKRSGKRIVAFLEYADDQEYYLATACDKIYLLPSSGLDLNGLVQYDMFLRGALDKLDVYPDALHIGEFKTAANQWTEKGHTPPHREMSESLTQDLYDQLVRAVAESRKKTEAEVRSLIDRGPFLPEDALRAGLIDDMLYEDQIDDKGILGRDIRRIEGKDYGGVKIGFKKGPRIAVIYAVGIINSGRSEYDPLAGHILGSDTLVEYIRKARADSSIRAIVLRVDSPGGSGIASDVIWRELVLTRGKKPLIASMSDLAASGGYYISMPADAIVAQPATLTGSIGVVAMKLVTTGLYEKLGINFESVSRGKMAEIASSLRRFTPEERQKVEHLMQAFYQDFVEKAASGRRTTPEQIDSVAQGRVWTGRQAKEVGLVDELGGLDRAIALAKQRANIPAATEVELVVYPPRKSFYELITERFSSGAGMGALRALMGEQAASGFAGSLRLFRQGEPLTLMPYVIVR